jgi:hypothetical protein
LVQLFLEWMRQMEPKQELPLEPQVAQWMELEIGGGEGGAEGNRNCEEE